MLKKDNIVCLVGASGSGKTTIAKKLEEQGYNIIHSYTTRQPREPDEWGHTFINGWHEFYVRDIFFGFENGKHREPLMQYIDKEDFIAYKEIYGDHYFATKEQYINKGSSVYVVCPDGAKQVRENVKDAPIITIFLNADESVRDVRLMSRHLGKERNKLTIADMTNKETFTYVNNRIEKDRSIFKSCKCDYVVDANRGIDEVVNNISRIIEDHSHKGEIR